MQSAVFAGFPAALNGLKLAKEVFADQTIRPNVEQAHAVVQAAHAADQALDVEAFLRLLAPDVVLRLGSQPELRGHEAVRAAISALFGQMQSIQHHDLQLWSEAASIILQAEVTFTRKDGRSVTLPYVNLLRRQPDGLLSEYFIYIDLAPLMSQ